MVDAKAKIECCNCKKTADVNLDESPDRAAERLGWAEVARKISDVTEVGYVCQNCTGDVWTAKDEATFKPLYRKWRRIKDEAGRTNKGRIRDYVPRSTRKDKISGVCSACGAQDAELVDGYLCEKCFEGHAK